METKNIAYLFPFIVILLSACSNSTDNTAVDEEILLKEWDSYKENASESEVSIFMWGGDEGINAYMDEFVSPELKEKHNITLNRVAMDTNEILQKLMNEKRANQEEGTIDIIWINGENFLNAKENDLLFGPFTEVLPNYQEYVDTESLDILYDFGTEVEGLEAPWGSVQFVFQYDSAKVSDPPKSFEELSTWVKENPGKFVYPEPSDFTGNAFLQHLLYDQIGGPDKLLENGFDEEFVTNNTDGMWEYLRDIEPFLWRDGETYPASLTELDRLYSQGEIWMTMGYNEARAESFINDGTFPESTKSFVLDSGSIGNTHFLAIPYNSPNKEGALVAINELLSPEAQMTKYDTTYWGESMGIDPEKLSNDNKEKLAAMERGGSVLPANELNEAFLPEVDTQYGGWIREKWLNEVVQTD
ncbi:ABC transporter substrate-binding protein [Salipaludibacillus neizhouensis]|uniref:ABC transporter substrate-binding protein n=1 Tax=Salipaludibacillus neizhouensis TaxID=885475 RepID=A0A3A9KYK2_9BACI|nr:ABC transporter substrate-binding protein [Salipaludibacillus neizhouensis]